MILLELTEISMTYLALSSVCSFILNTGIGLETQMFCSLALNIWFGLTFLADMNRAVLTRC